MSDDESAWTEDELSQARAKLMAEQSDLMAQIAEAQAEFQSLIQQSGEGAGDDQADAGTKTFEREHEISLQTNMRDLLDQVHKALARIDDGTYGRCENCGRPIGKQRLLQANPRATMCVPCRDREDRF
jgi:RNA polymerase-binding protein DksA